MKSVKDISELVAAKKLTLHHTSYFRGYVSRVTGPVVESYSGQFGRGYVVKSPNWDSSNYSFITYYIESTTPVAHECSIPNLRI